MQSVTVDGKPHPAFDPQKETITLTPSQTTLKVRVQY